MENKDFSRLQERIQLQLLQLLLEPLSQGYILCKIQWPGGGGMVPWKKMKNEAVGNKMKKKEKGKRKKGKGKRRKGKGGT